MADVDVDLDGPIMNGVAAALMDQCSQDIVGEVSDQAFANVRTMLDRNLRNPTPYYETQVTRDRPAPLTGLVHDRGIIYGPWLEGTSSRNGQTRFKGYASFRRAAQQTDREAEGLAESVVRRYVQRIGG